MTTAAALSPLADTRSFDAIFSDLQAAKAKRRVLKTAVAVVLVLMLVLGVIAPVVASVLSARGTHAPAAAAPVAEVAEVAAPAPVAKALVAAATAAPVAAAPAATPQAPKTPLLAVVVGIDHAPGTRVLQGAVAGADRMRDLLVSNGYPASSIAYLTEGRATRAAVLDAASRLALAPAHATTVFSFDGHGRPGKLVLADGTLSSAELAGALRGVRSPMWVNFGQCYAGSFAVSGIVGAGRVVTFASKAGELAYEWQGASGVTRYMVGEALQGGNASTIEAAFTFAHGKLAALDERVVPLMDDRYDGELSLSAA